MKYEPTTNYDQSSNLDKIDVAYRLGNHFDITDDISGNEKKVEGEQDYTGNKKMNLTIPRYPMKITINNEPIDPKAMTIILEKKYERGEGRVLNCKTCKYTSFSVGHMKEHVVAHINNLKFFCNYCVKTSKSQSVLRVHLSRQHKQEMLALRYGGHIFMNPSADSSEEKNVEARTVEATTESDSIDDFLHSLEKESDTNMLKKSNDQTEEQHVALKSYFSMDIVHNGDPIHPTSLTKMQEDIYSKNIEGKVFNCKTCDYSSYSVAHMKEHVERHIPKLQFCCKYCEKSSKSSGTVRAHTRQNH